MRAVALFLFLITSFSLYAQESAIDKLAEVARTRPSSDAWYDLAEAYANAGVSDSSLAILRRILPSERNRKKAGRMHQTLGWLLINKGLYSMAEKETLEGMKQSLSVHDSTTISGCYTNLGSVAQLNGLDSQALVYMRKSLEFTPGSTWCELMLVYSLIDLKQWYEAIGILQKVIASSESNTTLIQAHYFIGSCFLNVNAFDSAYYHIKKNQALSYSDPAYRSELQYSYWLLGNFYNKTSKPAEAKHAYKTALSFSMPRAIRIFDDWNARVLPALYHDLIHVYQTEKKPDSVIFYQAQEIEATTGFLKESKKEAAGYQLSNVDEQVKLMLDEKERDRKTNLQYLLITLIIFIIAGIYFISAGWSRGKKYGPYFSAFILILTFEFVLVLLDPYLTRLTDDNTLYKFLINVAIAIVLIPLHKLIEKTLRSFALIIQWKKVDEKN